METLIVIQKGDKYSQEIIKLLKKHGHKLKRLYRICVAPPLNSPLTNNDYNRLRRYGVMSAPVAIVNNRPLVGYKNIKDWIMANIRNLETSRRHRQRHQVEFSDDPWENKRFENILDGYDRKTKKFVDNDEDDTNDESLGRGFNLSAEISRRYGNKLPRSWRAANITNNNKDNNEPEAEDNPDFEEDFMHSQRQMQNQSLVRRGQQNPLDQMADNKFQEHMEAERLAIMETNMAARNQKPSTYNKVMSLLD